MPSLLLWGTDDDLNTPFPPALIGTRNPADYAHDLEPVRPTLHSRAQMLLGEPPLVPGLSEEEEEKVAGRSSGFASDAAVSASEASAPVPSSRSEDNDEVERSTAALSDREDPIEGPLLPTPSPPQLRGSIPLEIETAPNMLRGLEKGQGYWIQGGNHPLNVDAIGTVGYLLARFFAGDNEPGHPGGFHRRPDRADSKNEVQGTISSEWFTPPALLGSVMR